MYESVQNREVWKVRLFPRSGTLIKLWKINKNNYKCMNVNDMTRSE